MKIIEWSILVLQILTVLIAGKFIITTLKIWG